MTAIIDFDEARRKREQDPTRVRCAHCRRWIAMDATRCTHCGVHFNGEAFQFSADEELQFERARRRRRLAAFVAMMVAMMTFAGSMGVVFW